MKQCICRWISVCLTTLLSCSVGWAQSVVTGKVTGAGDNAVLPGTTVSLKGTTTGTTTDANGTYRISVGSQSTATLVFSSVGFLSQEIAVGNQSVINVSLAVDTRQLNEVVVVGYGTVRKSDLTGSLAQVKAKELSSFPAPNVLQALSGRAPGVQVIQNTGAPGAAISVRIRGANSVQGSNEPLYVIDGFPIAGGSPSILNSNDIESMEILKDASATAIYGSRGANGVVLITTKQGKAGKVQVDYEGSYSVQSLRKKLDLMNAKEYATFYNEQATNDGKAPYFTQAQIDGFSQSYDWQDLVFRKAPMQTHNLTVSGGNEKTHFSIGGSLLTQQGIIPNSDFKRYSLRANITTDVSSKFSLTYGATLSKITSNRQNNSGGNRGSSLISAAISAPPTLTPYNDDGSYRVLTTAYPFISNGIVNPINVINETSDKLDANRILANAALTFKPFDGLAIKISGGIENADDRTDTYQTTRLINSLGNASVGVTRATSFLSENTVSYLKTIGQKHSLAAVAGFTYQDFLNTSLSGSGTGFLSNVTETYNLASATTPGIPSTSYGFSTLLSYLGRINYSYNNRYLATISFRADGSSKYSEGNKWGYFPSGALAWRVSEEPFMKNVAFLSDLKLRASWGLSGSQAINAYATLNMLSSGKTVFNDALYTTFAPSTTLPGDLKWETTEQTDAGVDMSFFNNRLHATADYYIKNTRDLLNTVQLPSSFGYTTTIRNVGEIQNKGFEFSVDGRVIDKAVKWDVSANIAFNRSKVIKLYNNQDILGGNFNVTLISDAANLLRQGLPVGVFYGYVEQGYSDKGQVVYKDLNGDGVINQNDKTVIGNPNPKFIYGFNSSVSFKGLELSFFIQGVQGNDLANLSAIGNTLDFNYGLNMPHEVYLNHWTPTHTDAKYPVISSKNSYNFSNRNIENGSFMRLRNIQLAYTLPLKQWGLNNLRRIQIYASGQNLLTITKYSWWDPEVNSLGGANSIGQGIDYYTYPTTKSVTFGLRIGF
ncbi:MULTISPECIES: TonB-dependent receptor [unclassified Spirosoma]|uniref:SusC/RagA family TonB-linked outer membrane protein n=1 Tax=unclassified Spirosoma TaxID=2621999 RepID=UPI00096343EE|nr:MULTISPECIES: TonB-dependent receptor [unclassified Spirosoma]MBN8825726.1 TonB-dependent receptor [Spirosoma sp.]OJW76584.1 MAG: SusC/RagA family TonB-linked outer membrane protein [Spirosoma sp. 48-14]